jgi:hypothetical protein
MLENRSHAQPRRSAPPREFFLPVDVYISNQAAAALRKVRLTYFTTTYFLHLLFTKQPNPRKKAEKRESSSRGLSVLSDDNPRKVKGKRTGAIPMQSFTASCSYHRKDELVQPGPSPDYQ